MNCLILCSYAYRLYAIGESSPLLTRGNKLLGDWNWIRGSCCRARATRIVLFGVYSAEVGNIYQKGEAVTEEHLSEICKTAMEKMVSGRVPGSVRIDLKIITSVQGWRRMSTSRLLL